MREILRADLADVVSALAVVCALSLWGFGWVPLSLACCLSVAGAWALWPLCRHNVLADRFRFRRGDCRSDDGVGSDEAAGGGSSADAAGVLSPEFLLSCRQYIRELMWSRVRTLLAVQAVVSWAAYITAAKAPKTAGGLYAAGFVITAALYALHSRDAAAGRLYESRIGSVSPGLSVPFTVCAPVSSTAVCRFLLRAFLALDLLVGIGLLWVPKWNMGRLFVR